jgi:hypothetical protein
LTHVLHRLLLELGDVEILPIGLHPDRSPVVAARRVG